jgi:small subunit ribosomal protein S15Ae
LRRTVVVPPDILLTLFFPLSHVHTISLLHNIVNPATYHYHYQLRTHAQKGYIGEFEIVDDHRAQKIVVELNGRLNKCGVISPRFDVQVDEIEKWIVALLPSRQFGQIILSTTYGIMTHEEARRKKTGGKVLGFFY